MTMSLGLRNRVEQRLTQKLELTEEQKLVIEVKLLQLRRDLLQALRKEKYSPTAKCPHCGHELTAIEIMRGFYDDVNDLTTGCPGCGARFQPQMIFKDSVARIELPFYCPAQTLDRIASLWVLSPDELCRKDNGLYRSAIFHFGTLKSAFSRISTDYGFDEITEWKKKVKPFLGKIHDTVIADFCGVGVADVRKHRKSLKIRAYSARRLLKE